MRIYKSKIDWWLPALMVIALGFPLGMGIIEKEYLVSALFAILLAGIFVMFHYTVYKLDGGHLIVWNTKIDINAIRKINKTRNPISSPALSLDRIEIIYNKFDSILISPKDKQAFVEELLKINPNIVVNI
jgi:hypothetical protein